MRRFVVLVVVALGVLLLMAAAASASTPTLSGVGVPAAGTSAGIFTPTWATLADVTNPTVSAIEPVSAANDIDTSVTITGTGFATDPSGATPPTVTLGSTSLTNVAFVDATTLTATVPWGMNPGPCTLTVTNPDGGTAGLAGALTVTQGIGQWNGGNLFGGEVRQILMKPGDANILYAPAYGIVGLFRSTDAGGHWTYVGADLPLNNGKLAIDPLHADWLYGCTYKGLQRSTDEGDTWTTVMPNTWPDGRSPAGTEVFPSPSNPQVLFISAHDDFGFPPSGGALGLIKSTNGGTSWQIVADLEGISVVDVAFDPNDSSQMVLVTSDARVFQSTDGGDSWSEVAKPPLSNVGVRGKIAYNPYTTGEVWIASMTPSGICKSTDAALTGWKDVTEADGMGGWDLTFSGPLSVYTTRHHSTDGGSSWDPFGPMTGYGQLAFDPNVPLVAYLGDNNGGVQKTTDGGTTWEVKNQGLAGMTCSSLDVSRADPLRVFAAFTGPGIYRSDDGTTSWNSFAVGDVNGIVQVREDPTDSQRVYAVGHDDFYRSTDAGKTWSDLGWNASPPSPSGLRWVMEPDPFQSGHVLVGLDTGPYLTGPGYLYSSGDFGASWQPVAMPQALDRINDIAFDPVTPGLVYVTTNGTGIYRTTNSGSTWARIDDPRQAELLSAGQILIATHPQHMVTVEAPSGYLYRSVDGGTTWQRAENAEEPGVGMFADADSTRLYRGSGSGLFFSQNAGDSWTRAAGAFGGLQIMALGYADAYGHTIIYAATNGGETGTSSSAAAGTRREALATTTRMVDAGIYRYVVVGPKLTLKLSGLRRSALRRGRYVTTKGVVTPGVLAGGKVKLQVQRWVHRWATVKTALRTIGSKGGYSWRYKPAKRGSYRLRATIAKTATNTAVATTWRKFKVK